MEKHVVKILLALFLLDFLRLKLFEKPRRGMPSNTNAKSKDEEIEQRRKQEEKDLENVNLSLEDDKDNDDKDDADNDTDNTDDKESVNTDDDNDDIDKFKKSKAKDKKEDDTKEEDKAEKPKKKKKSKKHNKKVVIDIKYCKVNHEKYFTQFKMDLLGNFTNVEVNGEEYPLPPLKKALSKYVTIAQMGCSMLIFMAPSLKNQVTFIPPKVFELFEKFKWAFVGANFLGFRFLSGYLASSGAFEVTIDDVPVWSKLSINKLPTIKDIKSKAKLFKLR